MIRTILLRKSRVAVYTPSNVNLLIMAAKDDSNELEQACYSSIPGTQVAFPIVAFLNQLDELDDESKKVYGMQAIRDIAEAAGLDIGGDFEADSEEACEDWGDME